MALTNWIVSPLLWWNILATFGKVMGYNIYEEQFDVFRGDSGSLFGYSVLQHENSAGKWILVGAPKSSSVQQPSLKTPGALFKCQIYERSTSTTHQKCQQVVLDTIGSCIQLQHIAEEKSVNLYCYHVYAYGTGNQQTIIDGVNVREIKDDQWLGVSLDSYQESPDLGTVVVCGHRWVNNYAGYYLKYYEYPEGICYTVNSKLEPKSVQKMRPCLKGIKVTTSGIPWHGWCQVGTSAHYTNNGTLLLGAPGTVGWRGTVISMAKPIPNIIDWSVWFPDGEAEEGYVGYALTSGSFTSPTAKEGVTGAPRAYELGKVFIFDLTNFAVKKELYGDPMNTYFGSSLAALDLNNDGLSDLLVGAPLYTDKMDEGRVYVYINQGEGNLQLLDDKLRGNNAIGARFGTAIAVVGDLNKDGYQDVAIGAPSEDDNSGAVYLYHGSVLGLKTNYAQRLAGKSVNIDLRSFGSSLSGGMDMDGNGYPDIVVGAHQNATIVFYRSQPVLRVEKTLHLTPKVLGPDTTICSLDGRPVTCVRIRLCLRYTGYRVPVERAFIYTIAADVLRTNQGLSSRFFFITGQNQGYHIEENIVLQLDQESCAEHTAYLKTDVRDFLNTIPFKSIYSLHVDSKLDPTSGLPLVLSTKYPHTITKEVTFLRNCGTNAVCETDMKVASHLRTSRGNKVLYLGAQDQINVNIEVTNNGEEAHQAFLSVMFPPDVVYIGFEPVLGAVLPCGSQENMDGLQCILGNPMEPNKKVQFKLRFDASSLKPSRESLNFTVNVHTSSVESNDTLYDNMVKPSIPVLVFADLIVRGASHPEQVVYRKDDVDRSSLEPYLDDIHQVVKELEVRKAIGPQGSYTQDTLRTLNLGQIRTVSKNNSVLDEGITNDEDKLDIDESVIGPSLVFNYEIRNLGPSYIPFSSVVNITIPWQMKNGDWLIYLKGLRAISGVEACNIREVLVRQSENLKKQYQWDGSEGSDKLDGDEPPLKYEAGLIKLDCNSATCVTVTCHIQPLYASNSVVIEIQALLWQYSFLKHAISVSAVFSEASVLVDDPLHRFTQPDKHKPDAIQVVVTVTDDLIQLTKPIPPWIIIAATAGGITLLVVLIIIMAKLGFFHRTSKEEMEKLMAENKKEDNIEEEKF